MNYLATLTRPAGAHYGAERRVLIPDSAGWDRFARLAMPDGSTPRVRVLSPEAENAAQVRVLVPVGDQGQSVPGSREMTVSRSYWDTNARSTFLEGAWVGADLLVSAVTASAIGASVGYFLPSYGALRGAGVGLAYAAGARVGSRAGLALSPGADREAHTVPMRVGSLVGGVVAAVGTARWVGRR